jgi:hypothetical protein
LATNPATAADLQHRSIKTLSANEVTVGGYLLTDAWNILLASRPSIATRLDALPLDTRLSGSRHSGRMRDGAACPLQS